jgi:hypothetical protein
MPDIAAATLGAPGTERLSLSPEGLAYVTPGTGYGASPARGRRGTETDTTLTRLAMQMLAEFRQAR